MACHSGRARSVDRTLPTGAPQVPLPRKLLALQARLGGHTPPPPDAPPTASAPGFAGVSRRRIPSGRVLVRALLVILTCIGALDLGGKVLDLVGGGAAPAVAAAPTVDEAAARQIAVAFTADYLTYDSDS